MEVDVKTLTAPDLVKYARSLGIQPHGLNREALEGEIALASQPIVPVKENKRLAVMEDILNAQSLAVQKLQHEMKQVQTATGLRKEDENAGT